jgi:hypothetical protein
LIRGTQVELTGAVANGPWVRIATNGKVGYALASSLDLAQIVPSVQQTQATAPAQPVQALAQAAQVTAPAAPPPAPPAPAKTKVDPDL